MHAHDASTRRLQWVFSATALLFAVEVVAALYTRSTALASDSAHMLADVAALALALGGRWMAARPANSRHTYGYGRFELFSAAANAALLLALSIAAAIGALSQLAAPTVRHGGTLLVVASLGLIVNAVGILALHRDAKQDLNVRAAFTEVVADAFGSLLVLGSALLVPVTGWTRLDPLAGLVIAALMVPRALQLGRDTIHLLADGVPAQLDVDAVRRSLIAIEGVTDVHDLHLWSLSASTTAASAHLGVAVPARYAAVLREATEAVQGGFPITHVTFQIESGEGCSDASCCTAPPPPLFTT